MGGRGPSKARLGPDPHSNIRYISANKSCKYVGGLAFPSAMILKNADTLQFLFKILQFHSASFWQRSAKPAAKLAICTLQFEDAAMFWRLQFFFGAKGRQEQ